MFGITISLLLISTILCGLSTATSNTLIYNKNSNNVTGDIGNKGAINWAILICGSDHFSAGFESDIRDMYVLLTDNLQYDDDNIYYGLLEGVCITVRAKTLKVKFANPSSGKVAYGTYEILSD